MTDYELAHSLFVYDPAVKGLRWKVRRGPIAAGEIAGCDNGLGYYRVNFKKKLRLCSHIIWLMHTRGWPVNQLDHINRDTYDDRIENLRDVTQFINMQNQLVAKTTNKTGFRGVALDETGKYRATIVLNHKQIWLGRFNTPEAAHEAYLEAKSKYHEGAIL